MSIACGYSHSAAITADAQVFVWGSGSNGKLGQGAVTEKEDCFAVSNDEGGDEPAARVIATYVTTRRLVTPLSPSYEII